MRKLLLSAAVASTSVTLAGMASAATLQVGPNQAYTKPCDAIAAAQPNDIIEVSPGTYTDSCEINVAGLTVRGVGGQPKVDLSGTNHPADYKGIYVIQASNVTIENLELTGANIADSNGANGAGLRIQAVGATVRGCFIHDNQEGILAGPLTPGGTITVEYSELSHNGLGNGCNVGGCTHNIYVNEYAKFIFQYNWSHDIGTDGHLLKSRADETDVLYNRLTGEMGLDSYEIDMPNGGLGIVVGNVIQKGPSAHNPNLVSYGEEGLVRTDKRLFLAANTLVNDFASGTFVNVASGGTLTAHDNLFVGAGTVPTGLSADNLSGADPLFVDPATYDYHLKMTSPAIGKGVDPGMADTFSLTPTSEYVHPLKSVARLTAHDIGAFEYGTNTMGAGQDGGTPESDGGTPGPDASVEQDGGVGPGPGMDGSVAPGTDGGPATQGDAATAGVNSGGCGCQVAEAGGDPRLGVLGLVLGLALVRARRRRRS